MAPSTRKPPNRLRILPKKSREALSPADARTLQAFDALILAMALDEAPGDERKVLEKWTAARTARNALLFS